MILIIFTGIKLSVKRPLLGYPSVLFTGGYNDAVQKLIDDSNVVISANAKRDIGLYDPNVALMEIIVEVRSLGMDTTIRKRNAKDNFAFLYSTTRSFPDNLLMGSLMLILLLLMRLFWILPEASNCPTSVYTLQAKQILMKETTWYCPTARDIRITVRAINQEQTGLLWWSKS